MTHLAVVSAGTGSPSTSRMLADRLAAATNDALGGDSLEVRHVELREYAVDLATMLTSHVPSERLTDVFRTLGTAAGVVVVTPIMNAGPSGLVKLFFDLLDEGVLSGRPVVMGATGGSARHSLAIDQGLLPMFFYLKAAIAPTAVFAATDDWGTDETDLPARIERAGRDFAELIRQRPVTDHADEFASVPDFEQLLRG